MGSHEDKGIEGREEGVSISSAANGKGISQQDTTAKSRVFSEKSRRVLDNTTVVSEYRAGYTTITVKSIFDGTCALSDLVCEIAKHRLTCSDNETTLGVN